MTSKDKCKTWRHVEMLRMAWIRQLIIFAQKCVNSLIALLANRNDHRRTQKRQHSLFGNKRSSCNQDCTIEYATNNSHKDIHRTSQTAKKRPNKGCWMCEYSSFEFCKVNLALLPHAKIWWIKWKWTSYDIIPPTKSKKIDTKITLLKI